jgi:hypothetical protein
MNFTNPLKSIRLSLVFLLLIKGIIGLSYAQNIILKQSNESGIYEKGESIQVSVLLKEAESDLLSVKITENFVNEIRNEKIEYPGKEITIYNGSYNEPISLIFEIERSCQYWIGCGPGKL